MTEEEKRAKMNENLHILFSLLNVYTMYNNLQKERENEKKEGNVCLFFCFVPENPNKKQSFATK